MTISNRTINNMYFGGGEEVGWIRIHLSTSPLKEKIVPVLN
jgi:hypothetical protein